MQELTIISSEISKGTINKRNRRKTGLQGGVITFVTSQSVFLNDIFSLVFNDKTQYYKVEEISTIDANTVEVAASEYGYWGDKLSRQNDFDVRSLIDLKVSHLNDIDKIKQIRTAASYC